MKETVTTFLVVSLLGLCFITLGLMYLYRQNQHKKEIIRLLFIPITYIQMVLVYMNYFMPDMQVIDAPMYLMGVNTVLYIFLVIGLFVSIKKENQNPWGLMIHIFINFIVMACMVDKVGYLHSMNILELGLFTFGWIIYLAIMFYEQRIQAPVIRRRVISGIYFLIYIGSLYILYIR